MSDLDCKGIILAGGTGSRLYPNTIATSKQLLPIYDKPMIYYSLSVLMLANIRDILLIANEDDISRFKKLLGNGDDFGISISYEIQKQPRGIAEALIIGERFIDNHKVGLVLGDNLFYGQDFSSKLIAAKNSSAGANIFAKVVSNPSDFGIVELDNENKVLSIEEKPHKPKSDLAITGLYFYDNNASRLANSLKPSKRGELEISELNALYLENKSLEVSILGRGFTWLDTGNQDALLSAGNFVQNIEHQQGFKIACLEEIAFKKNWISEVDLERRISVLGGSAYTRYLSALLISS